MSLTESSDVREDVSREMNSGFQLHFQLDLKKKNVFQSCCVGVQLENYKNWNSPPFLFVLYFLQTGVKNLGMHKPKCQI